MHTEFPYVKPKYILDPYFLPLLDNPGLGMPSIGPLENEAPKDVDRLLNQKNTQKPVLHAKFAVS